MTYHISIYFTMLLSIFNMLLIIKLYSFFIFIFVKYDPFLKCLEVLACHIDI